MRKYAWYALGALALCGTALAANVDKDFRKLDKNGDGYISLDEAKQDPLLARHFYKFDKSQTGQLDKSEFASYDTMNKDKIEPWILRHEWEGYHQGATRVEENN